MDEGKRVGLYRRLRDEYGPVYQMVFVGKPIACIVTDGHLCYVAEKTLKRGPVMQRGAGDLLTTDSVLVHDPGEAHRKMRRPMTRAFGHSVMSSYFIDLLPEIESALLRWSQMDEINVLEETSQLARNFLFRTVFRSSEMSDAEQQVFVELFDLFAAGALLRTALPDDLHKFIPNNARYQQLKIRAYQIIRRLISDRRSQNDDTPDILGLLLVEAETGAINDRQIEANLLTLFIAGYETTSNVIAWVTYILATEPDATAQITDEIQSALVNGELSFEDIYKLHLVEQFRKEALRMYGPSYVAFGWTGHEDFELEDWLLPKENLVFLATSLAHTDATVWPDADRFLLDRVYPPWNMPFGNGQRVCIGKPLAELDIAMFIVVAAHKYTFSVDRYYVPEYLGTLRPPKSMKASVRSIE